MKKEIIDHCIFFSNNNLIIEIKNFSFSFLYVTWIGMLFAKPDIVTIDVQAVESSYIKWIPTIMPTFTSNYSAIAFSS